MSNLATALTIAQIKLVHEELVKGEVITAAQLVLYGCGESPFVQDAREADKIVRGFFNAMVDGNNYVGAAALCWGPPLFHPELASVRDLFEAADKQPLLLSMGASSMGKTYNLVIFCYMDWLRDPEWTSVKLMSQSDKHLAENVWPHLKQIHEACALKPEGVKEVASNLWMGLEHADESYGFSGHAFRQSQLSSGVWKGFKSQPKRPMTAVNYPVFGPMTRLRVLMDEAQQIPAGVWQDLESVKAGIGEGRVKIFAAFNPEDVSQPVVQLAEPVGGWHSDQQETLYSYESSKGWWVVRLDGAKCENVIQRKEVYPGVMRYEAFVKTLQGGGDTSPRYWTFARGFPPLQNSAYTVIPPDWASTQRGEAIYVGRPENIAAVDLAYQGQDKAVIGIGRWGLAHGWRDQTGKMHSFQNRLNPGVKQPRHVLTVDQFFTMPKSLDAVGVTQEVMGKCNQLKISPEWVAMDKTGNAMATYSYASVYWGKILGINWAEKATEMKVLSDDAVGALERFDGIPSEMWFALKHWMDPNVCAVLFNPTIQSAELYTQMTTRRYKHTRNGRLHIESKDEFKSRNAGKSPDEVDVVVMMLHLCRVRGGVTPGIIEQKNRNQETLFRATKVDESPVGVTTQKADVDDPLEGGPETYGEFD
jgi:hypothetical protein